MKPIMFLFDVKNVSTYADVKNAQAFGEVFIRVSLGGVLLRLCVKRKLFQRTSFSFGFLSEYFGKVQRKCIIYDLSKKRGEGERKKQTEREKNASSIIFSSRAYAAAPGFPPFCDYFSFTPPPPIRQTYK